jgi:hypothetical protein
MTPTAMAMDTVTTFRRITGMIRTGTATDTTSRRITDMTPTAMAMDTVTTSRRTTDTIRTGTGTDTTSRRTTGTPPTAMAMGTVFHRTMDMVRTTRTSPDTR